MKKVKYAAHFYS